MAERTLPAVLSFCVSVISLWLGQTESFAWKKKEFSVQSMRQPQTRIVLTCNVKSFSPTLFVLKQFKMNFMCTSANKLIELQGVLKIAHLLVRFINGLSCKWHGEVTFHSASSCIQFGFISCLSVLIHLCGWRCVTPGSTPSAQDGADAFLQAGRLQLWALSPQLGCRQSPTVQQ